MTDRASAPNKATTGHSCCGGDKAQVQAPKNVAAEVKSAGGCCGGDKVQAQSATIAVDPGTPTNGETSWLISVRYFSGAHTRAYPCPQSAHH